MAVNANGADRISVISIIPTIVPSQNSSNRKLLNLKDKGRRDYTLTSPIPGPSSGVHFKAVHEADREGC